VLHVTLLALKLTVLPITPDAAWKPQGDENPSWRILGLLAAHHRASVLPAVDHQPTAASVVYAALRARGSVPAVRAVESGVAVALLAYPVMIEPWVSTGTQSIVWSWFYALFVLSCGYAAIASAGSEATIFAPGQAAAASGEAAPRGVRLLTWLALAAMASFCCLR